MTVCVFPRAYALTCTTWSPFSTRQAVEKLVQGAESGCPTEREKQVILNSTRILTRILPYIFEDQDWRGFFWSTVPGAGRAGVSGHMKGMQRLTNDDVVCVLIRTHSGVAM